MKKSSIIMMLILVPFFNCFAQNTSIIKTGELLSIQPVEPCVVYLDGQEIGVAPIFISDLSEKNRLLQLMGKNRYAEVEISYDARKTAISYYKPVLGEYYGTITVDCNVKEAVMSIDGKPAAKPEQWFIKLSSGKHLVSMECDGFIQESVEIDVPRLETVAVKINLKQGIKIVFSDEIPADSSITFRQAEKELEFSASMQDDVYLSSGIWECSIENIFFEPIRKTITVSDSPVTINTSFNYFKPQINITKIAENSTVFIGDADVTGSIESGLLNVPIGTSELLILNEKYLPFHAEIQANDGKTIIIIPEYNPDPEYIRSGNITIGSILAGTGAALLTGGLLLSNNDFLSENSSDYNTYSTLKYTALGTGAAGLLLLLGGSLFGGISALSE
ncbi:MAG: hypothetical protein JEZ04_22560 [Spirochaetales bacterium]|nr:hypothetical protein [Spirochaetales bacterium]